MNRCAAGNELPKRGLCPKCGAGSNEPCPEALRIAYEQRETLITALEFIRDGYERSDVSHEEYRVRACRAATDALVAVGGSRD